jgi:hypothetical protein
MTHLRPHQHHLVHCHPQASWGEASCAYEARMLDDVDDDGPMLLEEVEAAAARKEIEEWLPHTSRT